MLAEATPTLVAHWGNIIVGSACLLVVYAIFTRLTAGQSVPRELLWVGVQPEKTFARVQARIASLSKVRELLKEGYEKYSKQGKSYIYPNFRKPEIILPPSLTKWLIDQPDTVLSTQAAHFEVLECQYNFTSPYVVEFPYHEHVIRKVLPRRLGLLTMDVWDEIRASIDEGLGTSTDSFRTVCLYEIITHAIARISNRMFLGLPLCRNAAMNKHMVSFASALGGNIIFLSFIPAPLKPILGRLFTLPNQYHWRQARRWTLPLITQRIADIKRKIAEPDWDWEEPNDYVSWHVRTALAENQQGELDPILISRRLMALNFASIHTTSMTFTNLFFDLIAAEPGLGYVEALREETARVYKEGGGVWSKGALQKCVRLDSAIRESMRVSTFVTRALTRKVVVPGGVEVPGQGKWSMPKGAFVSVDSWSVMHDPEIYPEPMKFDAFRFSRIIEAQEASEKVEGESRTEELIRLKSLGMITTSDIFLSFGHGKHACPGRFFVSHEIKMLLAYIFNTYDIEPIKERPANMWFGSSVLPPMKATINVRRKKVSGFSV